MSANHPISDSDSDWDADGFLPPGLQSDASEDSLIAAAEPKVRKVPSIAEEEEEDDDDEEEDDDDDDDEEDEEEEGDEEEGEIDEDIAGGVSRTGSKAPSTEHDEYAFEDAAAEEDAALTHSFLSIPEGLEPPAQGSSSASKKPKAQRKRTRKRNGSGESPKRRKRKQKVKERDEDDEEAEEGGKRQKKSKGKGKSKNKPNNMRRNIKTFLTKDQLDTETLSAQREEEERKKRLEEERRRRMEEHKMQKVKEASATSAEKLQEALATISAAIPALASSSVLAADPVVNLPKVLDLPIPVPVSIPIPVPVSSECIMVDSGSDSEKDARQLQKQESEVITISSDEEVTLVSDEEEDEGELEGAASSGMHTNDEANVPDTQGRVLVNVNHPPDEPDIYLPENIARAVKPHQVGGIRFLYDNLVESLVRFKNSSGFGCILAHSMGLGKTLQSIAFTSIFMQYTKAHTVLCIVPINTLQNWLAEYDMWCLQPRHFNIFVLNDMHKTTASRAKVIGEWREKGGVLLMGYEMYRLLARSKPTTVGRPKKKNAKSGKSSPQVIDIEEMEAAAEMAIDMKAALCNPGPDMVVCDEGHRIKNSHAGISQALKNIRTRRRVVLTGYPLQNNLQEYWCMVDFVRPNFLGTRHEFANLFERPISNGQCMDSTPFDVRLMRYRAHVLHSLLAGFVQRRGFNVLFSTLPPKEEHVILIRLTSFQRGLYIRFMQSFKEAGAGGWCSSNPLKAFSVGCKIWNHPDILADILTVRDSMADDLDADLDLPEVQAKCNGKQSKDQKEPKAAKKAVEERSSRRGEGSSSGPGYIDKVQQIISFEWARDIMKPYKKNKLCNGGKMIALFHILEESIRIGDKILVFSQSLSTLTLIEKFLSKSTIPQPPNPPPLMPREWVRNKTYFRLDGSTAVSEREKMINQFNKPDNRTIWLFLLSTKAGCLGINLIGANRVVVMDASWNPCHDAQAVCRVYRYGQTKKCFVYRLVSDQTLEKKIYDRQVSKKGMSDRVVDEMNPEMNLTKKEVESLLEFDETDMPYEDFSHLTSGMDDKVLISLLQKHSNCLTKAPFTTDSLLWDRKDMKLTRAEKMQAKKSYEEEKKLNMSYSRPSYSNYYPKNGGSGGIPPAKGVPSMGFNTGPPYPYMSSLKQPLQRPVANVRPIQSTPVPRQPPTPVEITQRRLRDLKNAGVTLQRIVATTDIILPGVTVTTDSNSLIRAGEAVTFIKTKKGIYLRTPTGKILAVRGPHAGQGALGAAAQTAFPDTTPAEMAGVLGGGMQGEGGMAGSMTGEMTGGISGMMGLQERFGNMGQNSQSNLANSQLGQLLAQSNPSSQPPFGNPSLPPLPDRPSIPTPPQSSSLFPFTMNQPTTATFPEQTSSPMPILPFSSQPPASTPFSLGSSSTLTMATDTIMHTSVESSPAPVTPPTQTFPGSIAPSSSGLSDTQTSFPDLFKETTPSPSFSFPSYGEETWSNPSPASVSADQASMTSSDKPAAATPNSFEESAYQSPDGQGPSGAYMSPAAGVMSPASLGSVQSINLPSSLPYGRMDAQYPPYQPLGRTANTLQPENSPVTLDDGSDISNLTKFVDSSFPHLMPFSGSLNPDGDSHLQPSLSSDQL